MSRPGETPNAARVYDYVLNGEDEARYSLPADRAFAKALIAADPGAVERTRRNREFVLAVAEMAAGDGIGQFLDLGAGFPADPSVHGTVQKISHDATVIAVDSDPIVTAAWESADHPGVTAVRADIGDAASVLPWLPLDLARPACVIFGSVLHLLGDPGRAVDAFKAALAPGSWMAISIPRYGTAGQLAWTAAAAGMPVRNHSADDLVRMLSGLIITGPGVSEAGAWLAGIRHEPNGRYAVTLAGAGVKP